jgi:hypothetical protein
MAAAMGTLMLGAFGSCCLLPICDNFCLVLVYGLSLFCMWVTLLASGGGLTGVALLGPEHAQKVCAGDFDSGDFKVVSNEIHNIDNTLVDTLNIHMCGQLCPCNELYEEPWTSMTEKSLNSFNRTKNPAPDN